jgi:hypothetical protein
MEKLFILSFSGVELKKAFKLHSMINKARQVAGGGSWQPYENFTAFRLR